MSLFHSNKTVTLSAIPLLIISMCLISTASEMILPLKKETVVKERNIRLRDVVSSPLLPALGGIVIGPSPAPGLRTRISPSKIYTILISSGIDDFTFQPVHPAPVTVTREARVISPDTLWNAAESALASAVERIKPDKFGFRLLRTGRISRILLPSDGYAIETDVTAEKPTGSTDVAVKLRILSEEPGFRIVTRTAVFRILWTGKMLTAGTGGIDSGITLSPQRTQLKMCEVSADYHEILTNIPDGFRTRRKIPEGKPVLISMLEPEPIVKEGDRVTAVWKNGAIVLSIKVKVLEDGWEGSIIKMMDGDRRRILTGRVTENGEITLVM